MAAIALSTNSAQTTGVKNGTLPYPTYQQLGPTSASPAFYSWVMPLLLSFTAQILLPL